MIALMYHDIVPAGADDSSGFPGRDAALYKVAPEMFEMHLAALDCRNRDAESVAQRDAAESRVRYDPLITFDDGGISALYAADELERYGRRGYFFITANYIGVPGFLDAEDLRDLHRRGHLIGSHSCSHPLRMAHCSDAQLRAEWTVSRGRLSDVLGDDVLAASVPGGDYARRVAYAAAEAGFRRLFTSEPTAAEHRVGQVAVNGRFTIQKWTTASTVAALASGAWLPCSRQSAIWTIKKIGKHVGGDFYLLARKLLLRHGEEVRWGDRKSAVRR